MKRNLPFGALLGIACIAAIESPAGARADSWTNQAGRVIEASIKGFDGSTVTLERTNGSRLRLPLTALCATDQQRARALEGQSVVPDFVLAAYRDARSILDRFERLPASRRNASDRQRAINMACAAFDARIQPRSKELLQPVVQLEVSRLRTSLATRPIDSHKPSPTQP